MIDQIKTQFQKSSSVICVDFRGVNVEKISRFRRQLRQISGNYQVVKNTLAKRAVQETPFVKLDRFLVGPTGIVFCPKEPTESAKIVTKFAEEGEGALHIKGGIIEGAVYDGKDIARVAALPPRMELLSQLVSAMQSPINNLVGTLQGVVNEFVYTLQAIVDQKSANEAKT
jgi:large subunit ribosomal protein L10